MKGAFWIVGAGLLLWYFLKPSAKPVYKPEAVIKPLSSDPIYSKMPAFTNVDYKLVPSALYQASP